MAAPGVLLARGELPREDVTRHTLPSLSCRKEHACFGGLGNKRHGKFSTLEADGRVLKLCGDAEFLEMATRFSGAVVRLPCDVPRVSFSSAPLTHLYSDI